MAYRLIGLAARMCLEMGLHRKDALVKSFPLENQWTEVTRIFWTVYSLDRRWSLGTGLPFVIQDEDIDPNLPEPVSLKYIPLDPNARLTYLLPGLIFALSTLYDFL